MKKSILICISGLVFLAGCNNKKTEPAPRQPGNEFTESGYANVFMPEQYLNASIDRFERNIHFYNNKISKSVWLDSAAICFLADFIRKPENVNTYDGFRVFLIQYDRMQPLGQDVPGQFHPNQISLGISPTINRIADKRAFPEYFKKLNKDFGALNHGELCPNKCQ